MLCSTSLSKPQNKIKKRNKVINIFSFTSLHLCISVRPPFYRNLYFGHLACLSFGVQFTYSIKRSCKYGQQFLRNGVLSSVVQDDSTGEMIFDEVFHALSRCLAGLAQPFKVPGTDQLFKPKIFITVLAYSSIIGLTSHQVTD